MTSTSRRRSTWPGCKDGEIPLDLLFSGTVFYAGPGGALQINRISWNAEAAYRLPVSGLARDDGPLLSGQRLAARWTARRSIGSSPFARVAR